MLTFTEKLDEIISYFEIQIEVKQLQSTLSTKFGNIDNLIDNQYQKITHSLRIKNIIPNIESPLIESMSH